MVLGIHFDAHHEEWTDAARKYKKILIESARDSGKSYFWAFAYPLWQAFVAPGIEICLVSYSQDQTTRLIERIKSEIEHNDKLKELRPLKDATWSKTELALGNGSKIVGESFGTSARGGHYQFIICDDPQKDFGGMNDEDQKRYFYGALMPMVTPGGQLIVDGTPIKYGDLLEDIESNKSFKFFKFPAIKKDGTPLWGRRYSLEVLEEIKKAMPLALFSREYLLERITEELARFKREWIRYYEQLPENNYSYFTAVDPAISQSKDSDYTAIVTVAVDYQNNWYVVDVIREKLDPLLIIEKLFLVDYHFKPKKIGIEVVAFQKSLISYMNKLMKERNRWLPIEELKTDTRIGKEMRILGLQPRFQSGGIFIKKEMKELLDEYLTFPRGRTDDIIDALAYLEQIAKPPSRIIFERDPYVTSDNLTGYIEMPDGF